MRHHNIWLAQDARDRCNVSDEIEIELVVQRRVDRIRRGNPKKRITIRLGAHDCLGSDIRACTWPVLNNELLAEALRQPLSYQACHDVGGTTGGESDDDAHWARRIGLRPSEARDGRQRGSARDQMQKSAAW